MDYKKVISSRIVAIKEIANVYEKSTDIPATDNLTGLYRHSVFNLIL